ncbi:MAG: BON domain-containing protein [Planctomyces sp.]|nr:BON domain-containing protein [Planctomyces sp.]
MFIRRLMILIFVTSACITSAEAQSLFGERTLGRSLSRRSSARTGQTAGAVPESGRRFLRDERSVTDFVGSSASGGGAAGFVGGFSATNAATSSVVGLTEEVRAPVNRPRIVRPSGLYAERLSLSSELNSPNTANLVTGDLVALPVSDGLRSLMDVYSLRIEVSPEDHSAILRGVVPSERDRETFELLLKFEPGIQKVVNELTVDPALAPRPLTTPRRSQWSP